MKRLLLILSLAAASGLGSLLAAFQIVPVPPVPENVAAVITQRCLDCHRGPKPAEKLSLEPDKILAATLDKPTAGDPARKLIDTSAPEKSYLLAKVRGDRNIGGSRMPARQPRLPESEIKLLEDWIHGLKGAVR